MANNHESTMKWKVDIGQLKSAMADAKRSISLANAEFKTATAGMDKWQNSTTGLEAKIRQLNATLPQQKQILAQLEQQYKLTAANMGEGSAEAQRLKIQIENQKAAIAKTEASIDRYSTNLSKMESANNSLTQTISKQESKLGSLKTAYVDAVAQYGEGSDEAKELANQIESLSKELADNKAKAQEASKAADQLDHTLDEVGGSADDAEKEVKDLDGGFTVLKGTIANLAAQAVTGLINGFKKLGSEIIEVGKQAYNSYSQYEQLVGGVETLFGEASSEVQKYASEAYKTAGMSANAYMETVTSFSATLLQGLNGDTAKAAKIADMAIVDMADNANKMGTSMELLQNAYQGFAKQNYTMLDNLKLGYGGTKTEMLRLVKDAGVVNKSVKSLDEVSFDKIIEAIHKVQQNMGITGTTAEEASDTIEGSTQAVKASWDNLMVAIADDNADLYGSLQKFTGSVETLLQNAVPRVKTIVSGLLTSIGSLLRQYAPEFASTVLPVLEDIGTAVKDVGGFIIDNFSTIAPIVMTAVAAITSFNAALAISKTIQSVTSAVGALAAGTSLATKAQIGLNAAMEANPIGAVIAAVVALIGVIVMLANVESEAEKAHEAEMAALEQQAEQIEANAESWDRLKDSQQEAVNAGMTELDHYQTLYDELEDITDANGRVKDGYEERASFITSQLADALGIEIQMVDGVIKGHETLQEEIDKTMAKKKAQIILDSQESMYAEAIGKQGKALQDFRVIQDSYMSKQAEYTELEKKYNREKRLYESEYDAEMRSYHRDRMDQIKEEMDMKATEISTTEESYNKQKDLLSQYAYNVGLYEQNMEAAHNEQYDKMSTVTWDYVKDYQSADDAQRQMLEDSIANEQMNLDLLKELKEQSGSDIYDQQIRQSEARLEEQKSSLAQYTSATESGLNDAKIKWQEGLAEQLSEITGKQIDFKEAGDGNVQMYADGVKIGEAKPKKEMAKVVSDTILEISKQKTGATTAGEDLIDGVNNGIANQNKQSSVFTTIANFGANLLSKLKFSLQEQSPSKATKKMGEDLLEGLKIGTEDKEPDLMSQISDLGETIIDTLDASIASGTAIVNQAFGNAMESMLLSKDGFSESAKSTISKASDIITDALEESERDVKRSIDDYFGALLSENEKQQNKLQKQYDNYGKKEKANLKEQIRSKEDQIDALNKSYREAADAEKEGLKKQIEAVRTQKKNLQREYDDFGKTEKENLKNRINDLKADNSKLTKLYKDFGTDVINAYKDAMKTAAEGVSAELSEKLQSIADTAQSKMDDVKKSMDTMSSKLMGYGDFMTEDKDGNLVLTSIKDQIKTIKNYNDQLSQLEGKVSDDLMEQITSMDVDQANNYMKLLLEMSDDELSKYDKLYEKKIKLSKKTAKDYYADDIASIKKDYTDKVQAEFSTMTAKVQKIGKQTIQGFLKGMKNADIDKSIKSITNGIISTMKKQLKIHSPSKVFEQIGDFSGQGYIIGLRDSLSDIKDVVASEVGSIKVMNESAGSLVKNQVVNFNQTINSPKAVDRLTLYRETNSLLFSAKVRMNNV